MSEPEGSRTGLPDARRYSDREVARILERATELQRAEPSATNPEGLTLAELTEIAREAGIEPALLRRASAEAPQTSGTGLPSPPAPYSAASPREPGRRTTSG